jgi:hypothetical protein
VRRRKRIRNKTMIRKYQCDSCGKTVEWDSNHPQQRPDGTLTPDVWEVKYDPEESEEGIRRVLEEAAATPEIEELAEELKALEKAGELGPLFFCDCKGFEGWLEVGENGSVAEALEAKAEFNAVLEMWGKTKH